MGISKIGIAIDPWKLTIFRRRLKAGGFDWTEHQGLAGSLLLRVETDDKDGLRTVVEAANTEAHNVAKKTP